MTKYPVKYAAIRHKITIRQIKYNNGIMKLQYDQGPTPMDSTIPTNRVKNDDPMAPSIMR